jgi:hypothetical protein
VEARKDGNHHFQRKRPPFVRLIHHKLVKLSRGFQPLTDQRLVIGNADFCCSTVLDSRVMRVADEFQRGFCSLSARSMMSRRIPVYAGPDENGSRQWSYLLDASRGRAW